MIVTTVIRLYLTRNLSVEDWAACSVCVFLFCFVFVRVCVSVYAYVCVCVLCAGARQTCCLLGTRQREFAEGAAQCCTEVPR